MAKQFKYIHTYVQNLSLQPFSQDNDLATYIVRVNFIYKWRDLQFKVDSERQIFWETFHGNFILRSEFLPEIGWEEIAEEIPFVFRLDVWPGTKVTTQNNEKNKF